MYVHLGNKCPNQKIPFNQWHQCSIIRLLQHFYSRFRIFIWINTFGNISYAYQSGNQIWTPHRVMLIKNFRNTSLYPQHLIQFEEYLWVRLDMHQIMEVSRWKWLSENVTKMDRNVVVFTNVEIMMQTLEYMEYITVLT